MASSRFRAPVKVSDVLAAALPGLGDQLLAERIRGQWAEIVGPDGNRHSRPDSLRHGTLTVTVDSSPWLQELTLRSAELLGRVQSAHGRPVTALRFALGRMPAVAHRRAADAEPGPPAPLGDEERRDIERLTAGIADPALAATLERLLTKDRLARARKDEHAGRARERHDA